MNLDQLTWNDRREIEKFAEFLRDSKTMTKGELVERYGHYMGLTEDERKKFVESDHAD